MTSGTKLSQRQVKHAKRFRGEKCADAKSALKAEAVRTEESNYWLGGPEPKLLSPPPPKKKKKNTKRAERPPAVRAEAGRTYGPSAAGPQREVRSVTSRCEKPLLAACLAGFFYAGSEWDFDKRKWKEAALFVALPCMLWGALVTSVWL